MEKIGRRAIPLLLVVGLVVGGLAQEASAAIRPIERRMARLVNNARENHGVDRLALSSRWSRVARAHSRSMAAAGALFHSCSVCSFGENVGVNTTIRAAHRRFMESAIHRSNILSTRYDRMGIGIVRSGSWVWVTEIFVL